MVSCYTPRTPERKGVRCWIRQKQNTKQNKTKQNKKQNKKQKQNNKQNKKSIEKYNKQTKHKQA